MVEFDAPPIMLSRGYSAGAQAEESPHEQQLPVSSLNHPTLHSIVFPQSRTC